MRQMDHEVAGTALIEEGRKALRREGVELVNVDGERAIAHQLGEPLSHPGEQDDLLRQQSAHAARLHFLPLRRQIDEQNLVFANHIENRHRPSSRMMPQQGRPFSERQILEVVEESPQDVLLLFGGDCVDLLAEVTQVESVALSLQFSKSPT